MDRATLRHGVVFAGIFGFVGVSMPFWPTLLASRGLSASTIGVLLALGPWLRFGINARVGVMADTRWGARSVFMVFASLLLVGGALLLASHAAMWLLVAAALIMAIGFSPLASLADASALIHARDGYARARLWGSIAFIACSLGLGHWLESHDVDSVAMAILLATIVIVVAGLLLPNTPATSSPTGDDGPPRSPPRTPLPPLLGVCLLAGLLNSSHAVLYGFGTLHWRSLGISNGLIGLLWTVGVLAEIVIFMFADRLKHGSAARWLLWTACIGGLLRWSLLAFTTAFAWQVAAQLLHGATFACAHLGILRRLSHIVAPGNMASAVTKVSGLGGGLAMGVGSLLAGVAFEEFAGQSYLLAAAASFAACVVLWSFSRDPSAHNSESGNSQLLK